MKRRETTPVSEDRKLARKTQATPSTDANDDQEIVEAAEEGPEIESASENEQVMEDEEDEEPIEQADLRIWRPGVDGIAEDEQLTHDPSTYDTFHKFELSHSCMALDVLPDPLGMRREQGPHTMYLVAGTQADKRTENSLFVVKCSNVRRTWKLDEDEESDDEDEIEAQERDPIFAHSHIKVAYGINSVQVMPQARQIVAAWGDDTNVHVYNIQSHLDVLDNPGSTVADPSQAAHFTHSDHSDEGFALAWNTNAVGQLLTGSRDKTIHLLEPHQTSWTCNKVFRGHEGYVESISWKKDDANLFISGSADKSVRLWDVRDPSKAQTIIPDAHDGDVNVVAFRPFEEPNQFLSGGDDGLILLRDIRFPEHILFKGRLHRDAVNVLDWHPEDSCTFLAGSYDDVLSIWGLDVEPEGAGAVDAIPEQVMFLHMGQRHIAAAKWHPQVNNMIISTAEDGLNIFRPENLMPDTTCLN